MKWVARKRTHLHGRAWLETTPEWLAAFREAVEADRAGRVAKGDRRPPVQRELAQRVGCKESIISALLSRKPPKHCRFIEQLSAHYGLPLPQYRNAREASFFEKARWLEDNSSEAWETLEAMADHLIKVTNARKAQRPG